MSAPPRPLPRSGGIPPRRTCVCIAAGLTLLVAACVGDLRPDALGPPGADMPSPGSAEATESEPLSPREALQRDDHTALEEPSDPTFRVGYGHRAMPWRAGAKPGQIGTAALPARDILLGRTVSEILRILNRRDPQVFLEEISPWATDRLATTADDIEPGRYHFLFEPGRGVEEPPAVNAFVLSQGDTHVAVASADLYLPHEQFHRRVAHLVAQRTGIQRDRLFLIATHNHSAPHAVSPSLGIWTFGDQFDHRHWSYMTHKVAEAVIEAWENRAPATVRTARTRYAGVQRNILGASTAQVRPSPDAEPETVQVGYPPEHVEDDLIVVRFDHADGSGPIGQMFVLGMHPETLRDNHGITSGEFNRHAERKIAERTGAPTLWLSGALGDVEPDRGLVNPESDFWRRGFDAMDRMTDLIADAVTDLIDDALAGSAEPSPVLLNLARDLPGPADHPLPDSSYLGPRYPMVRLIHDSTRIRLHLVRIHDVLLVGTPGEMPTDQSFNLKSRLETGASSDDVFQGYVFPDAPDWVRERIAANFSTSVASSDAQVPIVAAISLVNTYMGYIVTRWEFENRNHYRESLTTFGPGTADHVNTLAVALNEEMHGGEPLELPFPDFIETDLEGFDDITLLLRDVDLLVADHARTFPASDPERVGSLDGFPSVLEADPDNTDLFPVRLEFSWIGGTNDVDLPTLRLERETGGGGWEPLVEGPSRDLFLLFEAPDRWTASWRAPIAGETIRVVAEGQYRGTQDGVSNPDPIWDPDGRNVPYTFTSPAYTVPALP